MTAQLGLGLGLSHGLEELNTQLIEYIVYTEQHYPTRQIKYVLGKKLVILLAGGKVLPFVSHCMSPVKSTDPPI